MGLFFSLQAFSLLILLTLHAAMPYTVLMPDGGSPSTLIDAPQPGFIMNNGGVRTDQHEQGAVYDIMRATGNDWATQIPDVCRGRWHGIECMPDKDNVYHVVALSFGALSDDTAFPTCDQTRSFLSPSLTKLPHIRTLFFYQCFTNNPQPIPSFLGHLGPTLQTLVLRENGHVGPIPIELGNLTHLKVLDLHKNNINGSIPVSLNRITNLRSLDLSNNRLSGSIPRLSFRVLNILDLSQNLLIGSIPPSLGSCHDLLKIDFSRNRLSGPIPDTIDGLKNVVLLDFSFNHLSGPFPATIKSLNSLQALILQGNPMLSTTIPTDGFEGMNELMILVLSNMNLYGPIPKSLGQLSSLRILHLDQNQLNGSIPGTLGGLKSLSELRLNDNRLTGPVPFGREMVWRMRRKLRLYNNSGLCFNLENGFEDGSDLPYDSGIGYCETPRPESGREVEHLSSIDEGVTKSVRASSALAHKPFNVFMMLLLLILC